ncbi:MAG: phosphatase PAP2 family protein [Saprospiraceae bacterium]|nr:MAG: phosphatase PAP2 family protein [Saprospiraceae bacterium]
MMTELLQWDEQMFHLINGGWHHPFFDAVLPLLRNPYTWFPLYLFLLSFLLLNFKKQGIYCLIALALTVGVSDALSSQLIKKNVRRARPCKVYDAPADIHLLVSCGSGYSFPSSHAANHFSMAVFLCLTLGRVFRWIKIPLLLWAATIGFAQVYVGVHYPLDVLAGSILGCLTAGAIYWLSQKYLTLENMKP